MKVTHYIGFDIHKKSIQYCVKTADGAIVREGQTQRRACGAGSVGPHAHRAVAWSDGGDPVQRLGLRHAEAVCEPS